MAKYYYDRYEIKTEQSYSSEEKSTVSANVRLDPYDWVSTIDTFPVFANYNGQLDYRYSATTHQVNQIPNYDNFMCYIFRESVSEAGHTTGYYIGEITLINNAVYYMKAISKTQRDIYYNKAKGSFIETIVAEERAYPNDGIQGNYWYVKKGKAGLNLYPRIGGQVKQVEGGKVRIGGELKDVLGIWTRIDGQLKEV